MHADGRIYQPLMGKPTGFIEFKRETPSRRQLRRAGHEVTVFERADRIGGLLRYGIPQFKMEKRFLDRRVAQMEAEGVVFQAGVSVGRDVDGAQLRREFDGIVLAGGAT